MLLANSLSCKRSTITSESALGPLERQTPFPISLVPYGRIMEWKAFDADTVKTPLARSGEYFIPDFFNWRNHDSYQQAFQRLLRDLKAEANVTR